MGLCTNRTSLMLLQLRQSQNHLALAVGFGLRGHVLSLESPIQSMALSFLALSSLVSLVLDQGPVNTTSINTFKSKLDRFRCTRMGFFKDQSTES